MRRLSGWSEIRDTYPSGHSPIRKKRHCLDGENGRWTDPYPADITGLWTDLFFELVYGQTFFRTGLWTDRGTPKATEIRRNPPKGSCTMAMAAELLAMAPCLDLRAPKRERDGERVDDM